MLSNIFWDLGIGCEYFWGADYSAFHRIYLSYSEATLQNLRSREASFLGLSRQKDGWGRKNLASPERELELKVEKQPHTDKLTSVIWGAGSGQGGV